MSRQISIKDRGPQGYSLDLGKYVNGKGETKYRRHWLGQRKANAEAVAKRIVAEWTIIKDNGGDVWTADALARIELCKNGIKSLGVPTGTDEAQPNTDMLHAAIDKYVKGVKAEAANNQVSDAYSATMEYSLSNFKAAFADMPLASIDFEKLRSFVAHYVARPVSAYNGKKLRPRTATTFIANVRRFFMDMDESGQWTAPPKVERAFKYKQKNLWTKAEKREAAKVKVFELDELTTLWKSAKSERQRLYFLLALNCGFTQLEIATLEREDVYLDAVNKHGKPTPFIMRARPRLGLSLGGGYGPRRRTCSVNSWLRKTARAAMAKTSRC